MTDKNSDRLHSFIHSFLQLMSVGQLYYARSVEGAGSVEQPRPVLLGLAAEQGLLKWMLDNKVNALKTAQLH